MAEDELAIVFAKPALPGSVKTRLTPELSAEEAAEFHLAALADVVAIVRHAAAGEIELHVAGVEADLRQFRRLYPDLSVRSQSGADLGERLTAAFAESFAREFERAVVVGSDHPSLPPTYLRQAFDRLSDADATLGPSEDGGYYAVGLRRASWPHSQALFRDIPWSTPEVLAVTLERARSLELSVATLEEWYDVDEPADLERLARDASAASATGRFLRGWQQRRRRDN